MTHEQEESLQTIGRNAMSVLRDMVAALECDWDRLAELRDERDNWEPEAGDEDNDKASWTRHNPEDAQELAELEEAAQASEKVKAFIAGKTVKKIIVIPGKLVNIVVG